jgi:hypothetical protein
VLGLFLFTANAAETDGPARADVDDFDWLIVIHGRVLTSDLLSNGFFNHVANVWVRGAKTAGPIAKVSFS